MATLAGAGESYTQSGASGVGRQNAEDVGDFITNISPTETPFISQIGKVTATAVVHDWLTHSLAAAAATNVWIEGTDASLTTPTTLTRLTNSCQINAKAVAVSGTQDKVKKYGMGRELAYRVLLHTKEIKRDMETAALQNTAGDFTTGTTTVARRIKGVEAFVTTNTATITTAPTVAAINTQLQLAWAAGGNPDCILVNGNNKQAISALTTGVVKNLDANDRRFTTAVDVYESDFSVLKVVPDRFDNTQTVKILEMDLWKVATLRPMEITPLAKTGDTTKRQVLCEWTLESRAENGNAILTTA